MQLICPACGEGVKAENVNVQQMVAVCSACDQVFQFSLDDPKPKRRKVKQPPQLDFDEADDLHLSFRTNFRLDKSEAFLSSLLGSVFLTFTTFILMSEEFTSKLPLIIPLGFGIVTLFFYYWMALTVYNKTHIVMDDESIRVSRQPLPSLFNQTRTVNLAGVRSIYSEETAISQKEAYDTPRFHVWAEMEDGSRRLIVTDMIEDYTVFIAQKLNERLNENDGENDVDLSRLVDVQQSSEIDYVSETMQASQTNHHLK